MTRTDLTINDVPGLSTFCQCCSKCAFWEKIQPNPESWGTCNVKLAQVRMPDPMWMILQKYHFPLGSTGPNQGRSCSYFQQKPIN